MTGHPIDTIGFINAGVEVAEVNLCVILLIERVEDFFITAVNVVKCLVIIVQVGIFTDVVFSDDLAWPQTCSLSPLILTLTPQLRTTGPTVTTADSVAHV